MPPSEAHRTRKGEDIVSAYGNIGRTRLTLTSPTKTLCLKIYRENTEWKMLPELLRSGE